MHTVVEVGVSLVWWCGHTGKAHCLLAADRDGWDTPEEPHTVPGAPLSPPRRNILQQQQQQQQHLPEYRQCSEPQ